MPLSSGLACAYKFGVALHQRPAHSLQSVPGAEKATDNPGEIPELELKPSEAYSLLAIIIFSCLEQNLEIGAKSMAKHVGKRRKVDHFLFCVVTYIS